MYIAKTVFILPFNLSKKFYLPTINKKQRDQPAPIPSFYIVNWKKKYFAYTVIGIIIPQNCFLIDLISFFLVFERTEALMTRGHRWFVPPSNAQNACKVSFDCNIYYYKDGLAFLLSITVDEVEWTGSLQTRECFQQHTKDNLFTPVVNLNVSQYMIWHIDFYALVFDPC